jgi:hypothetical protein
MTAAEEMVAMTATATATAMATGMVMITLMAWTSAMTARMTTMMAATATAVAVAFLPVAAMVMSVVAVHHHWFLALTYLSNHTDMSGRKFKLV